jgi:hypothetical protein
MARIANPRQHRHQDTKIHHALVVNDFILVQLCAFAPWWQKKFRVVSTLSEQNRLPLQK